jgi:uncharacterized protein YbjT (DUF2867 family)
MPTTSIRRMTQILTTANLNEEGTLPNGDTKLTDQQRETAQYVADMVLELRNMAKSVRLYTITVPLEYAYYEAFSIANHVTVPPAELERLRNLAQAAKDFEAFPPSGDGSVADPDAAQGDAEVNGPTRQSC